MTAALAIALGYLAGSIPVAWLAGRTIRGVDIRDLGSGNVGASNVWQSVSHALVIPVGLLQIVQGLVGVVIARALGQDDGVQVVAGLAGIVANDWNPWLGFTGGRGVGPAIGFLLAVSPVALVAFAFIALVGVALRAVPQFVALGLALAPAAALVATESTPVVAGCALLAGIVFLKRVLGNAPPAAEHPRPQVWLFRLVYDRDVRDRDAWVRRGLPKDAGNR